MNKAEAERIIATYIGPIYGFALRHCRDRTDAQDLSQEIAVKAFRALLFKDDIDDVRRYIWTVAHNTLHDYYRDMAKTAVCVPIDEIACRLPAAPDPADDAEERATVFRLRAAIAHLSKTQRQIVIAYYFRGRRQADIAAELGISPGTVKWHLFEAKKELKRSVVMERGYGRASFDPIRLTRIGQNGSVGTMGGNANFLRSALAQNIVYAARNGYRPIGEIADELGVSPVYVESEAAFLAEYGFLSAKGSKVIAEVLIDEPDEQIVRLHDEMYGRAAELMAEELFTAIGAAIGDGRILGGRFGTFGQAEDPPQDGNFLLWALIPFAAANGGGELFKESVPFVRAATYRPDGGHNICTAAVFAPAAPQPRYADSMKAFCGCCESRCGRLTLWQCDSEWSAKRIDERFAANTTHDLTLLARFLDGAELSDAEYAALAEQGYLAVHEKDGAVKAVPHAVILPDPAVTAKLLAAGGRVKRAHWDELCRLKAAYAEAVLAKTPPHLHTARRYGLQHIFFADPWLILHILKRLTESGRLRLPTAAQKKMLTTVIAADEG